MNPFHTQFNATQRYFQSHATRSLKSRKKALKQLAKQIKLHEQEIFDALKQDLNKNEVEAFGTEIGYTLNNIRYMRKNLSKWAKSQAVDTPFFSFSSQKLYCQRTFRHSFNYRTF